MKKQKPTKETQPVTEQVEQVTQADSKEFQIEFKGIDVDKLVKQSVDEYSSKITKRLAEEKIQPFFTESSMKLNSDLNNFINQANKTILDELQKLRPVEIKIGERDTVIIEGRLHEKFQECIFICEQERQLFMSGAAGSGKTTLAHQIAKAFNIAFNHISCSSGLSEGHLLGRMLFDCTYVKSDFIKCYEDGGLFLFDEIDAADSNTMLVVNSALSNGYISVPNRKENPTALRHKDFICVCAGNTWGNGSFEYHGRNHLDAAFLDRFAMAKVHIEYDMNLEKDLCGSNIDLATLLHDARSKVYQTKVRRVISTRSFVSGARQMMAGMDIKDVVGRLTLGWSTEEKSKVFPSIFNN